MEMSKPRIGKTNRVAVIGLGRFGSSLARSLHDLGYEVTTVDLDARRVEEAADHATLSAQGDATDEELLRSLEVHHSDVTVVSMGEAVEASLLATLILKRIGVPIVIATAKTELHSELLGKIGADRVIYPEHDAAVRLAHALAVFYINDYISLSPTVGVAKFVAPGHFADKTLEKLLRDCREKVDVLLIKRAETLLIAPSSDEVLRDGDEMIVVGSDVAIEEFVESGVVARESR
jgi:trk system potassium uptake protein TrkA